MPGGQGGPFSPGEFATFREVENRSLIEKFCQEELIPNETLCYQILGHGMPYENAPKFDEAVKVAQNKMVDWLEKHVSYGAVEREIDRFSLEFTSYFQCPHPREELGLVRHLIIVKASNNIFHKLDEIQTEKRRKLFNQLRSS